MILYLSRLLVDALFLLYDNVTHERPLLTHVLFANIDTGPSIVQVLVNYARSSKEAEEVCQEVNILTVHLF